MKNTFHQDKRGFAHVAIIAVLVVILAAGGAGYYVYSKNKKDKNTNSSSASTGVSKAATEATNADCMTLYNDKNLCKAVSKYGKNQSYKLALTSTDKSGKVSTIEMQLDSKSNTSMVTKEGSKETSALISLNGDSYIKDETSGSWTKYPKSTDTTQDTSTTNDFNFDFKGEIAKTSAQRISYKNLGKEACGKLTCYKYQETDPSTSGTTTYFWIGTSDYLIHQFSTTDSDGTKTIGTIEMASVTISVPSPVVAAPTTPTGTSSQTDVQNYLNQVQSQGTGQ